MNRRRWLIAGLLASIALNGALLTSMLLRHGPRPQPHSPPPEAFRAPFKADPGQRQKIDSILRRFRIDALMLKQDILAYRVEILDELGNPECDAQKIREKIVSLSQLEAQINNRFVDALLEVADILDSQQRLALIYQLSQNWYFLDPMTEKGGQHE